MIRATNLRNNESIEGGEMVIDKSTLCIVDYVPTLRQNTQPGWVRQHTRHSRHSARVIDAPRK